MQHLTSINNGARYKGKQISVPQPETLAKNTLDATHKSRLKFFKDEKKTLLPKKAELIELESKLQKLQSVDPINKDYTQITLLEDNINTLRKDIEYIESGKAELEYYSKAGELLIEFYENVSTNKALSKNKGKKVVKQKGKSVYDFFMQPSISESVQSYIAEQRLIETGSNYSCDENNIDDIKTIYDGNNNNNNKEANDNNIDNDDNGDKADHNDDNENANANANANTNETDDNEVNSLVETNDIKSNANEKSNKGLYHKLTNFVEKTEGFKRADFFGEYLNIIDPHYVPEEDNNFNESITDSFCESCNCYRNLNAADATMVCPQCSSYVVIVIDSDKPNYKDPPAEISNFPYRRINHFNECLSQFQAKESTEIPQIVYDIILTEMKKERLTNMTHLTREKVHTYLKKQANKKFTNYYEHIPHIIHRLTGIQPKTMSPKMEEELRRDFHKIQEPYALHKPKNRKNFLNYNYVLHKLCQIRALHDREYKEFLPCFSLLKSRDKLLQQDIVWKKICTDLGWKFIKSV